MIKIWVLLASRSHLAAQSVKLKLKFSEYEGSLILNYILMMKSVD